MDEYTSKNIFKTLQIKTVIGRIFVPQSVCSIENLQEFDLAALLLNKMPY